MTNNSIRASSDERLVLAAQKTANDIMILMLASHTRSNVNDPSFNVMLGLFFGLANIYWAVTGNDARGLGPQNLLKWANELKS